MKRIAAILLGALLTAFQAHAAGTVHAVRLSTPLTLLDPYLVAPQNLGNIDLSQFLSANPDLANYAAAALAGDSSSAAIVLFETSSLSDVTFNITSGTATLLPYGAGFLSQAPQTGTQSLTVAGGDLLHVNGHYYAAALLQGPLAGWSSQTIGVQETQDGNSNSAGVALVIPPLVLVHGLWGDKSSLENVREYVDSIAPWKSQTQLVVPVCYSIYLAFDATTDPLGGKDPCEVTSEASLQAEIDSLMAELDNEHIVGGRVDIVAHSMGGLATRNYASQAGYPSLRNRMLGQFHTIVTLDTPEIGSLLANWLVKHRTNTRRAPKWTPPGLIWSEVCGSTDVETCFASNAYPLTGPGLPIQAGGVYSLEPKGPSLTNPNLAGPNTPNTTWRAISATAPGNSALAFGLNTLISALYTDPYGNNVPTLNSILLGKSNDAIVTVASQTKGATAPYTFAKLSHTSLVSSILTWLTGNNLNDNSVTDDPSGGVYALAACWIATSGSNTCTPPEAQANVAERSIPAVALQPVDRIAAIEAPAKLVLGQPAVLVLDVKNPGAKQVAVYQRGEQGRTHLETVPILRTENNRIYVRVTPKVLGPVSFGIRVVFDDSGVSVRERDTYVVAPVSPPLVFRANDLPQLVLTLNRSSRTAMAHPYAVYPAPVGRVDLNGAFVSWRLLPQKGARVVTLDRWGNARAIAPGEAMAEARFGAATDHLHIIVRATQQ